MYSLFPFQEIGEESVVEYVIEEASQTVQEMTANTRNQLKMKESQEKMSKITVTPHYQVREKKVNYISILTTLNKKRFISDDNFSLLSVFFPDMSRIIKDVSDVMEFAVILHFFTPDGYIFAQTNLEKLLPDSSEFSESYIHSGGKPGFTKESLDAIKLKVDGSQNKLLCSMLINDMQLSEDDTPVNFGNGFEYDTVWARDAVVIMLNCLNGNWSIPLGYFLIDQIEVASRSLLIKMAIEVSHQIGVQIVSITVNEMSAYKAALTNLGCQLRKNIPRKPWFEFNGENIFVFFDTFRMMRSVYMNFFAQKCFFYSNVKAISWTFIENMEKVRKTELNLSLMKLNIKRNLFSYETVDVINACTKMNLDEFKNSFQTLDFILHLNKIQRIFNELNKTDSSETDFNFFRQLEVFTGRIQHLNKSSFQDSNGMSGILLNGLSLKTMAISLKAKLDFIPTKKLTFYQLDMFSDLIRFYSSNYMPNGYQIQHYYKKLMRFSKPGNSIETLSFAHCLENIRPENIITITASKDGFEVDDRFERFPQRNIKSKESYDMISEYQFGKITSEVTLKLIKTINCAKCIGSLISDSNHNNHSLKFIKMSGVYASKDVVLICNKTEHLFRKIVEKIDANFKVSIRKLQGKPFVKMTGLQFARIVFKYFSDKNVFESLGQHSMQHNFMENHKSLLIKAVALNYVEMRMKLNLDFD